MGRFCSPLNPNKHSRNAMVMFRPFHLVVACSLSFVTWNPPTVFARELVDGIVAVVNSGPIMKSEIDEKILKGPQVLVSPFPAGDDASDTAPTAQRLTERNRSDTTMDFDTREGQLKNSI